MIPRFLIEAYVGTFERDKLTEEQARDRILADSREDRLSVYLAWNGTIGFTPAIVRIMTEDFE
jgi:hypothetical protein